MTTTPLIQFTLLIPIANRQREFNFRKRSLDLYDGNTTDERGERYYFNLTRVSDQWKLNVAALPGWLLDNESTIVRALSDSELATS